MNENEKLNTETLAAEQSAAGPSPSDLEIAQAEAAQWRDKYVRTLAEFDNFRKRSRAELENVRESVSEGMLLNLLAVFDDMQRMLETPAADEGASRRAMELIHQKFKNFLDSRGIARLDCLGKEFNPEHHDAILLQPRAGFPAGVVLEEVTPGYKLGERVIRHAQVIVSSEAESEADADSTGAEQA